MKDVVVIGTIPSEIIRVMRLERPSMSSGDTAPPYQPTMANWYRNANVNATMRQRFWPREKPAHSGIECTKYPINPTKQQL